MFKVLLIAHIIFGFTSLVVGLLILVIKKGNNLHKYLGKIFYFSLFGSAFLSLILALVHPNYFLFCIGIFTLYLLITGRRSIHNKSITLYHTLDKVVSFSMLFFCSLFLLFGILELIKSNSFGLVFIVFASLGCLTIWQDLRLYNGKSKFKNFGLVIHLQRMIAAYIATVTAFLVVNNKILPNEIAWLLPTLLFLPLIILWSKKHGIKNN